MDLFCPHCTRRVTVPDDKAGLVLNCPLCAKQFMAPSLAPAVPAAPSPPPPAEPLPSYDLSPAPTPPVTKAPPITRPKPESAAPPPPPPPPGDYTRSFVLHLRGEYLPFVPTGCLLMIVVLAFFTWHYDRVPLSLWGLAFTAENDGQAQFLAYAILMMPAIVLAIASVLFEKRILVTPPALAPFMMWKDLIVGLVLGIAFLLLLFDYANCHFTQQRNPMMLAMKLAVRLHFLAVAASLLMFWVHWRKMKNAPPPKLEVRW